MKTYEIGALIGYSGNLEALDADFARLASLELNACQLNVGPGAVMTEEAYLSTVCFSQASFRSLSAAVSVSPDSVCL